MKVRSNGYVPRYWRRLPEPRRGELFFGECQRCGHEHHLEYCSYRLLTHPRIKGECCDACVCMACAALGEYFAEATVRIRKQYYAEEMAKLPKTHKAMCGIPE